MNAMASQITGVSMVCSTVRSGADQRKHESSASLAFEIGIHQWPMDSTHKGPVTRKMFPFGDGLHDHVKTGPMATLFVGTISLMDFHGNSVLMEISFCSHKGRWRGTLIFSLICAWTNGWINNRDAGDLRRHRAYYNVVVMTSILTKKSLQKFAHDITAMLPWHVQTCAAISWPVSELPQGEISIEFKMLVKNL